MKRFFVMSRQATCILCRTAGGSGFCAKSTAITTTSRRILLRVQACSFPQYNNNNDYYCSSLSSSFGGDGSGGGGSSSSSSSSSSVHRRDENDDEDTDDGDDDKDETEEDNKSSNDARREMRWYQNLRRYEKHLLCEQQQRHQPSPSASSSISIESSSSSPSLFRQDDDKKKIRKRRRKLDHHWLVPTGDSTLIAWMMRNRHKYRQGVLSKERHEALKKTLQQVLASGMNNTIPPPAEQDISAVLTRLLSPRMEYWREMYHQLCTFVQENDGKFPYDYAMKELASIPERQLWSWCHRQKQDYQAFQKHQEQLQQEQEHSHPSRSVDNIQYRIQKLEALGFVWHEPRDKLWYKRYQELKSYQKHHGDCLVPRDYPANPQLAKWVNVQRIMYKRFCQEHQHQEEQQQLKHQQHTLPNSNHNFIMQDRIQKLEALGFVWREPRNLAWHKRYQELKSYQKHYGDCLVPTHYPSNPKLAKWVSDQRTMYKRYCQEQQQAQEQQEQHQMSSSIDDTAATTTTTTETSSSSLSRCSSMTPQRLALLQELDFCWNTLDAKWMKRYRELQEHIRINNTVYNNASGAVFGNDYKNESLHDVIRMMMTTTPPTLPAGPLQKWLWFQNKRYKQYLQQQENSSSICPNILNPPLPQQQQQQQQQQQHIGDEGGNVYDDQRILATQLTLEKRFQLLKKLGFPWE